jgi:hypothetical protein
VLVDITVKPRDQEWLDNTKAALDDRWPVPDDGALNDPQPLLVVDIVTVSDEPHHGRHILPIG